MIHRSEARDVPRLLVAETVVAPSTAGGAVGRFFARDDAYVAPPVAGPVQLQFQGSEHDAQDEYYKSLLLRFDAIRAALKHAPPIEAISTLSSSRPISFPQDNKKARNAWRTTLLNTDPSTVQLACMDMPTILRIVALLADVTRGVVRRKDITQAKHIGTWIWGCLAKCHDVGQFTSEEVSDLRDLGKTAVATLIGFRDGLDVNGTIGTEDSDQSWISEDEEEPNVNVNASHEDKIETKNRPNPDNNHGLSIDPAACAADELERKKLQLQESLAVGPVVNGKGETSEKTQVSTDLDFDTEVYAILDMVITIVGEKYGQRDLLEFRDIWE